MSHLAMGIDVGGTHITAGIVDLKKQELINNSIVRINTDSSGSLQSVLESWISLIKECLSMIGNKPIAGIGLAMPGPFDYANGISEILGLGKYESLFGLNIRYALASLLNGKIHPRRIRFMNDAHCFLAGETWKELNPSENIIGLTLGTGFGSAFCRGNQIVFYGNEVPSGGFLYNQAFRDKTAEEYFNTQWFLNRYAELSNVQIENVKELANLALNNDTAMRVFEEFAVNLAEFLSEYINKFKAQKLIIGGSISKSAFLFKDILAKELVTSKINIDVKISNMGEHAALLGAGRLIDDNFYLNQPLFNNSLNPILIADENHENGQLQALSWRTTKQFLAPVEYNSSIKGKYNIYPTFPVGTGKISVGIEALVDELTKYDKIIIDGYIGVYWQLLADQLYNEFSKRNISVCIYDVKSAMIAENSIETIIKLYKGKEDSIFGKRAELHLIDFFDQDKLARIIPNPNAQINILIGCGAELSGWKGTLVYADLPKNELQFRMRSGSVTNLGSTLPGDSKSMYKRFYFVDWIVLNEHKRKIFPKINYIIDAQRPSKLLSIYADIIREGLKKMSENFFRVRPWFEPGAWGGSWIKNHIDGLAKDVPNYAWSFELIVPENGLIFESDSRLLEISFDFLMFQEYNNVLGIAAERFGVEFPIRFDFLDTFDGGNLSIQCHPRPGYIKKEFGENFTQDECYYILDSKNNAQVYLGFQEDIVPDNFRKNLEISFENDSPIDIDKYVQSHPVQKHDLLLIPSGTIHGSGKDNLVLEISSTPYIFTFKMYDWLRMDLDGKPRAINIDHAFNNLNFERKGELVKKELLAKPEVIDSGNDWRIVHLKTHKDQFYDIERLEFLKSLEINTNNRCHVCMLVEGESVLLVTKNGMQQRFNYAETFVIPAAAISYRFVNEGSSEIKIVKAFVK
jgi:predicted NBD/HSP70 family sugar kinase/mannose-6-phosphate isomerase class I